MAKYTQNEEVTKKGNSKTWKNKIMEYIKNLPRTIIKKQKQIILKSHNEAKQSNFAQLKQTIIHFSEEKCEKVGNKINAIIQIYFNCFNKRCKFLRFLLLL